MKPNKNGRRFSLKSPIVIAALFSKGQREFRYPLLLITSADSATEGKVVFSVSKKKFKRAVDRNRVKRQMRAVYFSVVREPIQAHQALVYVGNELTSSTAIANALKALLKE
ncbi:MAG: ribonuclease P protein component [Flavobacteriales bacterium]